MNDTGRGITVRLPAQRTNVCVGADTYSMVMLGSDTADKFAFIDMLIPPGGGPMPHAHECEETFYVVEGEIDVFCHDTRTLATAGSAVNLPGWAPHVFKNLGTDAARLFCIVAPAGLERQFLEIGSKVATRSSPPPATDPKRSAQVIEHLPEIAAKYKARVLPPDTFDHLMDEEELELVRKANSGCASS